MRNADLDDLHDEQYAERVKQERREVDAIPAADNMQQARHWLGIAKQSLAPDHRAIKFINEALHYVELESKK